MAVHSFTLFCSYYGDCLNLHSFPTRRSSDLFRSAEYRRGDVRQPATVMRRRQFLGEGGRDGGQIHMDQAFGGADRKSTRLNSSHVEISYAVFCLKKKIRGCCSSCVYSALRKV